MKQRLEKDLQDMYALLTPEDRYSFISGIMESEELELLPTLTGLRTKPLDEYFIKDFSSAGMKLTERIRPEGMTPLYQAEGNTFSRLSQCRIVNVDTASTNAYLRVNMSECSLLVARDEKRLWAAHLGLSQESQLVSALENLRESGFSVSDLAVVASVGAYQESMNSQGYAPRLTSVESYSKYGIGPQQIISYDYDTVVGEHGSAVQHNLAEVIVGKEGMLIDIYDAVPSQEGRLGAVTYHKSPSTVHETFVPAS